MFILYCKLWYILKKKTLKTFSGQKYGQTTHQQPQQKGLDIVIPKADSYNSTNSSQNHGMVSAGRDLWRSSSPTPSPGRVTWSSWHRSTSRWAWNVSRERQTQHPPWAVLFTLKGSFLPHVKVASLNRFIFLTLLLMSSIFSLSFLTGKLWNSFCNSHFWLKI